MIEQLSPPVRRLVAIGLMTLFGLVLFVFILTPLSEALLSARERLSEARFRAAKMEALAARPPADPGRDVPIDLVIAALDEKAASASFSALLGAAAARNGVTVTTLTVAPDAGSRNRLRASLAVRGPEVSLIRFIHEVEHGRPLIRFGTWSLAASQGQPPQVTLEGAALVAWSKGQ